MARKKIKFTLTNCYQTNLTWHLGDRFLFEGEGVSSNNIVQDLPKKPSKFEEANIETREYEENVEPESIPVIEEAEVFSIPKGYEKIVGNWKFNKAINGNRDVSDDLKVRILTLHPDGKYGHCWN
ncbi:MAG TPA: hypothetical protein PLP27_01780 [Crocinitomicaceae bacterium]|nr:hypothetical protein [Crocinitomicaceae bacterium]